MKPYVYFSRFFLIGANWEKTELKMAECSQSLVFSEIGLFINILSPFYAKCSQLYMENIPKVTYFR